MGLVLFLKIDGSALLNYPLPTILNEETFLKKSVIDYQHYSYTSKYF